MRMTLTTVERTDVPQLFRDKDGNITISIPMRIRKYSGRTQVIMPKSINYSDFKEKAELTILQAALARARRWQKMLDTGKFKSLRDIAVAEDVDPSYVSRVMNLNLLDPEIVELILNDEMECTASFNDFCIGLPSAWADQYRHVKVTSFS
jgi:hypothetical protein